MGKTADVVEKRIHLSADQAANLSHIAREYKIREDHIVEKALDIFFNLTDLFGEQKGWSYLSEKSLREVWDNDKDTIYDEAIT
ncbi:MAG: hypothetical protein MAG431_02009 [Chloroflexi bacterium]|nr:hypothetical protein [Chloroflexota bacterium]